MAAAGFRPARRLAVRRPVHRHVLLEALLVLQDQPGQQALPELQVPRVLQGLLARLAPRVPPVRMAAQDRPERWALQEPTALRAPQAPAVIQDPLVLQA